MSLNLNNLKTGASRVVARSPNVVTIGHNIIFCILRKNVSWIFFRILFRNIILNVTYLGWAAPAAESLVHVPLGGRVEESHLLTWRDVFQSHVGHARRVDLHVRTARVVQILEVRIEEDVTVLAHLDGQVGWLVHWGELFQFGYGLTLGEVTLGHQLRVERLGVRIVVGFGMYDFDQLRVRRFVSSEFHISIEKLFLSDSVTSNVFIMYM